MAKKKEKSAFEKLNPKHKAFYNAYIECMNAKKAYMVAYPTVKESTAETKGPLLVRNGQVRAAVDAYFKDQWEKREDYIGRIFNKLLTIIDFDITDFINENGDIDLVKAKKYKNSFPIAEIRKSISQGETSFSETKSIKSVDKIAALREVTRILGMIQEKVEHTGTIEIIPPKLPSQEEDNG